MTNRSLERADPIWIIILVLSLRGLIRPTSHRLLLGMVEDDGGLCLRICQLILQVLIIFEELANCQSPISQVHTQLVAI